MRISSCGSARPLLAGRRTARLEPRPGTKPAASVFLSSPRLRCTGAVSMKNDAASGPGSLRLHRAAEGILNSFIYLPARSAPGLGAPRGSAPVPPALAGGTRDLARRPFSVEVDSGPERVLTQSWWFGSGRVGSLSPPSPQGLRPHFCYFGHQPSISL
jgi:hypothetical protein